MSIFSFFQSDEVQFLSSTFKIKLAHPEQKDLDIGDLKKHIKSIESQIQKHKQTLQTMFAHPIVVGKPIEGELRNTLKDLVLTLMDDLTQAEEFVAIGEISKYEASLSTMQNKLSLLSSHVDFYKKNFKDLCDSEEKKAEKRKELQKRRQDMGVAMYDTKASLQSLENLISSIGEPPEVRKGELDELKNTLSEVQSQFDALKSASFANGLSFDGLLHLVTAEVLSYDLKQLIDCEASYLQCINACTSFKEVLSKATSSWEENIKDLFPKGIFTSDYEKLFHEYEALRVKILNEKEVEESLQQDNLKILDACLNRLMDPKNKSPEGNEAKAFREETVAEVRPKIQQIEQGWDAFVVVSKQNKDRAMEALGSAEEAMEYYFPALMHSKKINSYRDRLNTLRGLIPLAKFESLRAQVKTIPQQLENDTLEYDGTEITFASYMKDHYLTLKESASTDKIKDLGAKAQKIEEESLLLGIPLPHKFKDIHRSLQYLNQFHDNADTTGKLADFERVCQEVQKQVDENEENLKKIKESVGEGNEIFSELQSVKESYKKLQDKLDSAEADKNQAESNLAKAQAKKDEYERKKKQIKQAMANAKEELESATLGDDERKKINKLIQRLMKAAEEVKATKPDIEKELDTCKAELKDAKRDFRKTSEKVSERKEKIDKKRMEAQDKVMEKINPEIAALVKKWRALTSSFAVEIEKAKAFLKSKDLEFLGETIITGTVAMHEGYCAYWEQNMSTENVESLTSLIETYTHDVLEALKVELGQIDSPEAMLSAKQTHVFELKSNLVAQVKQLQAQFPPIEHAPTFDGEQVSSEILTALSKISANELTAETEAHIFSALDDIKVQIQSLSDKTAKVQEECEQNLSKEMTSLKDKRDQLLLEVDARLSMAKDTIQFIRETEKFIKMAFGNLTTRLKEITDAYIESAVRSSLSDDIRNQLTQVEADMKKVDFSDPGGLSVSYEQLEKEILSAEKSLNKEANLKEVSPTEHKVLHDQIILLKEKWDKQNIDLSKEDLTRWKVMFANAVAVADSAKERIKALEENAKRLSSEFDTNQSKLEAYPKLLQHLKEGIAKIAASKIKTLKDFEEAQSNYEYYIDLFEKSLRDPIQSQEQESMILLQEEVGERQKEDWESFIGLFEGRIMKELKETIETQKKNPSFPDNEKSALKQYKKDAQEALSEAKKAGDKGSYKEGRAHLSRIRGILQRLKRFPDGVNAAKVKDLKEVAKKWEETITNIVAQGEAIKAAISKAMEGEELEGLSSNEAFGKIEGFTQQFKNFKFETIVMKLEEGKDTKKWKEKGLSQVRDIRTLIESPIGVMITKNPFDPIEWAAIKKVLNTIEKSILLYRGN